MPVRLNAADMSYCCWSCLQEGESHALYTLGSVYHAIGKEEMRQGEARAGETLGRAVQYYK